MSYNPWFTNEKVNDEQKKCFLCNGWDKYIYEVQNKKNKNKISICFQCYHKINQNELFDKLDD